MTLRADTYGTVAEVVAYTRSLLDGQTAFNSLTVPTLTEVETFMDRASGLLNNAIYAAGFTPSTVRANSTAKLTLDDWVVTKASEMVEMTQPGKGWTEEQGSRIPSLRAMRKDTILYVRQLAEGWREMGLSATRPASEGFYYTGIDDDDERTDLDDTSRVQPFFKRQQFDNT